MSRLFPLLQRYILGEIVRIFLFVLLCLTVLLVFVGVVQKATDEGLGPVQVLAILPYIVPSLLPFTIPSALLLTICVVYGRLAGDQEITAAKAAGISVTSLLWPAFLTGAVLSVGSLLLTDQAIPWAVSNIERTIKLAMEDIFLDKLRNEHQYRDTRRGIDVTVFGVEDRTLIRPIFRYRNRSGKLSTLQADEATIDLDLGEQKAYLTLKNAHIDAPPALRIFRNGVTTYPIEWADDSSIAKARHLTVQDIEAEATTIEEGQQAYEERSLVEAAIGYTQGDFKLVSGEGSDAALAHRIGRQRYASLRTEKHSRYALACSCFFFTLLGGPFAVLKAKGHFLTSFLYCFLPITVGYYPLVLTLIIQAKKGNIDPIWSMWIGNAVLAIIGLYLLRRISRN